MLPCDCLHVLLSSMLGSSPFAPSPVASLLSVRFRIPTLGLRLSIAAAFSLPSGRLRLLRGCGGFIIQLPLLRWWLAVFSCYCSLIFMRSVVFFSSHSFDHRPFIPFTPPSFLTRIPYWGFICLCGFSYTFSCSLAHGLCFFHAGVYCLFSLAFFFLGPSSSGCGYVSFPCTYSLSIAPLLFRCTYFFVVTPMVRLSWQFPLPASSSPSLFSRVRFTICYRCCSYRYPPLLVYCLLPCLGLGYRCYLLTSPSLIYLRFLWGGGLYTWHSSSLGVDQCFCSCLFSFREYSYSLRIFLFYRYPGINARVFSAIIRSRSPLPRRFTSTLSAVCLQATPLAFRMLLHLFGSSIAFACFHVTLLWLFFVLFHRFLRDFHLQLFLFLYGFFAHCSYARLVFLLLYRSLSLCRSYWSYAGLAFLPLPCRLILIRWPLSVHIMATLSSLYAVSHTSWPSCCYSFTGPVVSMRFVSSSLPLPTSSYSLAYWRSDPRLFLFYVCDLSSMSWPSLLWFLLWGLFRVFFPSRSRSFFLYSLSFGSVR